MTMRLEVRFPQAGLEGEMIAYDRSGKVVELSTVIWRPFFYSATATPGIMAITAVDETGDMPDKQMVMRLSGRTGKLSLVDGARNTQPLFLRAKKTDEQTPDSEKRGAK